MARPFVSSPTRFRAMHRITRFASASLVLAAGALAQKPVATVHGRVLGPDGLPMANVEVQAKVRHDDEAAVAKARSDGDGMFVLPRLPDDRGLWITAQAPSHTPSMARVELSPERCHAGVELRLHDANTLRGRVVDPEGRPVAGAHVLGTKELMWFHGGTTAVETRSDADGRFTLQGVPIGDCVVRAWAPGFTLREYWLTALVDSEITFPPLLRDGATTLVITTEGLRPDEAANAEVSVQATRGGSGVSMPKVLGDMPLAADGTCRFVGLPDAEWHVEVSLPGVTFDPRSVRTKAGDRRPQLKFRAMRDGSLLLRGRLTDAGGMPLAHETLVCRTQLWQSSHGGRPGRATTDADGRFTLDAPLVVGEPYSLHLAGSLHALVQAKDDSMRGGHDLRYLVRWEDVADPTRELALVAAEVAKLTVTLRNADRQPVPFTTLQLQRVGEFLQGERHRVRDDDTRRRRPAFPGVHGTEFDVVVIGSGPAGSVRSEPFRLLAGRHEQLELVATAPGRVEGRLVDAGGTPLAGVRVDLSIVDPATGQSRGGIGGGVPSDRRGRFVFTGVAAGRYQVLVGLRAKTRTVSGSPSRSTSCQRARWLSKCACNTESFPIASGRRRPRRDRPRHAAWREAWGSGAGPGADGAAAASRTAAAGEAARSRGTRPRGGAAGGDATQDGRHEITRHRRGGSAQSAQARFDVDPLQRQSGGGHGTTTTSSRSGGVPRAAKRRRTRMSGRSCANAIDAPSRVMSTALPMWCTERCAVTSSVRSCAAASTAGDAAFDRRTDSRGGGRFAGDLLRHQRVLGDLVAVDTERHIGVARTGRGRESEPAAEESDHADTHQQEEQIAERLHWPAGDREEPAEATRTTTRDPARGQRDRPSKSRINRTTIRGRIMGGARWWRADRSCRRRSGGHRCGS